MKQAPWYGKVGEGLLGAETNGPFPLGLQQGRLGMWKRICCLSVQDEPNQSSEGSGRGGQELRGLHWGLTKFPPCMPAQSSFGQGTQKGPFRLAGEEEAWVEQKVLVCSKKGSQQLLLLLLTAGVRQGVVWGKPRNQAFVCTLPSSSTPCF